MKKYNTAPLPFQGQKRKFLKQFREALDGFPPDATYVDLFGGSGLLSQTVKSYYPDAKVVYNDYDNFRERLENIEKTNLLLGELRLIVGDHPRNTKIEGQKKLDIIEAVRRHEVNGFVDYISLSASILFAMKYVLNFEDLTKETFYNCIRMSDFNADDYLRGVTVVSQDYKQLFTKYQNVDKVIFLVDPPYLSTDVSTYKNYWKLTDYLDVLEVLYKQNYCYFTSSKSSIVELCEWIETKTKGASPFVGATKKEMNTSVNYNSSYTDIMLYSYQNTTL